MIQECNIRNYSIYYRDGYLFSYYEYVGDDYEADMAKMAARPGRRGNGGRRQTPAREAIPTSQRRGMVGAHGRGSTIWINFLNKNLKRLDYRKGDTL